MTEADRKQVCEAVTFAASLLALLKRRTTVDETDRQACEQIQRMLEAAEKVLYGPGKG